MGKAKRMTMKEDTEFKNLLEQGPFVGGPGRIVVERSSESPIENLLFSGLAVVGALAKPSGIGFFYREPDVLKKIEWHEHLSFGVDESEDFCKWYADQFDWHVYLQAGFPSLRRRVDAFAWPRSKGHAPVVIECDGFDYHSSKTDMTRDRERDRAFAALGYRVVRFTGSEIYQHPLRSSMALCSVLYPEMAR